MCLLSAVHVTVRRCLCVIVMLGSGGPPFLYTWTAARHVGFILEMVPSALCGSGLVYACVY